MYYVLHSTSEICQKVPTYYNCRGVSILLKNTHTLLIFEFLISTKASSVFNNSISKYLLKVSGYNPTIEAASAKEPCLLYTSDAADE